MSRNGKYPVFKYLFEEELITEDEFNFLRWYDEIVKPELEKEVK